MPGRRDFLWKLAAGAGLSFPGARGSSAAASCRIIDAATGKPVAARIRLMDARGREAIPAGHVETIPRDAQEGDVRFQSRRYAYVDGTFEIDPRLLPLRYEVVKGYEYLIASGEIKALPHVIALTRWSDLARGGWYGGDNHIHHIAPATCRLEMDAEDLNVANILTSDFTTDQERFEGKVNGHSSAGHLIYVNQEFRNDQLGHMCLLDMKKLIEPVRTMQHEHWPLHLDVCDAAHAQHGYVTWAHFPSWPGVECPLDVAMEKLDGLEILCVLDPRGLPLFMREVVPELAANDGLRLWYRFLNCGFRLTATAGTDKMTTFVTVGANRVFARVEGEFTYANWVNALRAGRTFISNSPVLSFTVNGQEPGASLDLKAGRDNVLRIHATAESQLAYDRMEIVVNGAVIADATPSGARHRSEIRMEHRAAKSCWVAARAVEDMAGYRSRGVDFNTVHSERGTVLSDYYGTRRPETVFAHSSPVYVTLDGAAVRSEDDAQYYARYLGNCIEWLKTSARFANASDRQRSIEAFERGRAVYERRAREARRG